MSTRLAALFVTAVLGVLGAIGVALSSFGWPVLAAYLAVVLLGLGVVGRQARALRGRQAQAQRATSGRTCTCCTSTVFDPIEIR